MSKYVKPTLKTKFCVDFSWWQGKNLRSFLQEQICSEGKNHYDNQAEGTFDWLHPETGEVFQVDILWHLIHTHCRQQPDFITDYTPLVPAIFRVFIANNNTPLTPGEIYDIIHKQSPEVILKTIGGRVIYEGIRPVL